MEVITAKEVYAQMMAKDEFTAWLGAVCVQVTKGSCCLKMTVRKEMCNGFGIAHGGIAYSLADSALAFASNSHGQHAVSIETSISHLLPLQEGDEIIATATEKNLGRKLAVYEVTVEKEGKLVALFKGTVYRKETLWMVRESDK